MTRFLIVEDHPLFREALESAVCLANPEAEIFQATSIDGAIEVLSSTHPLDLVLLDLSMPGTTGLSGVMRVRKAFPKIPVVIVSGYEDVQIVQNVLALGVSGYIPKSTSRREIADAIGEVAGDDLTSRALPGRRDHATARNRQSRTVKAPS